MEIDPGPRKVQDITMNDADGFKEDWKSLSTEQLYIVSVLPAWVLGLEINHGPCARSFY